SPTKLMAQTAAPNQRVIDDSAASGGKAAEGATKNDAASLPGAPKPVDVNAAILDELERMRLRIQELEAQLKAQPAPRVDATVAHAVEPTSASSAKELSVANPASASLSAPQAQAAPAQTEPAAPFAYADWTWLNGNSRIQHPVFDSKFFTPEVRVDT